MTDFRALYGKYLIFRTHDGSPIDFPAFVLRTDGSDPAALAAVATYAAHPSCPQELARDLTRLAQPAPAAEGEVAELVQWLRHHASATGRIQRELFLRAADLLSRQAVEPVPVSERLPGAGDVAPWPDDPDATPWAWAGKYVDGGYEWVQLTMLGLSSNTFGRIIAGGGWSHWLPAHALPLPTSGEVG